MGVMSGLPAAFRVTYPLYGELRDDIAQQMARGGLLVKVHDAPGLDFDSSVALELVLPDGTTLQCTGRVLQIFAGYGVAVTVDAELVEQISRLASRPEVAAVGTARHERVVPIAVAMPAAPPRRRPSTTPLAVRRQPATSPPPLAVLPPLRSRPETTPPAFAPLFPAELAPAVVAPPPRSQPELAPPPARTAHPAPPAVSAQGSGILTRPGGPTRMEKIQLALHGTRDERNAILRDRDRTLHGFVLKNPQLDADDVVGIAKNPQMTSDMLQQIGDRKEWLQRPSVALALARNPRTPGELAVRALAHVPLEALRQLAKGSGVPPHVTAAARKKLLG